MGQINLLPWREEARKVKQIYFALTLLAAVLVAVVIMLFVHLWMGAKLHHYAIRSVFLQSEITQESTLFDTLKKKKEDQMTLESRVEYIFQLRANSFNAVRLLDELVTLIPRSVSMDKIVREGNHITLTGKAQAELQITLFMKNLTQSPYFKNPKLTQMSVKKDSVGDEHDFELKVDQQG